MTTIKHPVMRYHGAKFRLADWIISFFPKHDCYVEPFGGAGSVLMKKERSYAEVYNDLDGEIVNVFRVLQVAELRERLIEMCVLTPFSRDEFLKSYEPSDDPVEQARRTLFRAEAGFGSAGACGQNTGFRTDARRAYSLASHVWAKYPERIAVFGERLSGVIIENKPAVEVIQKNDTEKTLFYVDPPYVHGTRVMRSHGAYKFEMDDQHHIELLDALKALDGSVVLSGYDSDLYNDSLQGWKKYECSARISSGKGTANRQEVIWINQKCAGQIYKQSMELFA
jgi:DNA adenine methylase